jgi:ABC-type branched-subunit amino acid transport system ATPase component
VSLVVNPGEIVGLIGTNGAGKSTLMNAISGFAPVTVGTIEVFGTNVARLGPPDRAALGLGRVFQDARLYPDLTVAETVAVALEAHDRTELVPSLLALPPSWRAERRKRAEAGELLDGFGLGRFADTCISELSTGTRRFVELACLVATRSRLLLLDEPTAGIAQREVEQFAPYIADVRAALSASVLLIEHDMPVVMSLCDRIYCLSAGEVIAEGTPNEVRNDERVVESYLGNDMRAVDRSGVA